VCVYAGGYRHQAWHTSGGAGALCGLGGHGAHYDRGAGVRGPEVHGGHDAQGRSDRNFLQDCGIVKLSR